MNLCYLIGKVISKIELYFMLNSKHIAIVLFELELENKNIIKIKCYDELADFAYKNIKQNDNIFIEGKICSSGEVEVNNLTFV